MIDVAIIEDDNEIREVIRNYLNSQKDFSCSLAEPSVESFLVAIQAHPPPNVLLCDIGLPGMNGISGMRLLKDRFPDIDIIMLTIYNDAQKIFDSLRAGASGYLLKNTPLAEIKGAVQLVLSGGAAMSPQIARKVIEHFKPHHTTATPSPLSPREKEIVIGLVDGLSYKMIADRMGIATETVRFHIKNIYKKLHVHSKAEVITRSMRGEI
jgi:DNA-binding NarL/FixJ family response regulator